MTLTKTMAGRWHAEYRKDGIVWHGFGFGVGEAIAEAITKGK